MRVLCTCCESEAVQTGSNWFKPGKTQEKSAPSVVATGFINLLQVSSQPISDFCTAVRFNTMATQRTVDAQSPINLSQLQSEASNGAYTFTRPLTILNCAVQHKYVVYASYPHCLKGMLPENNDCFCPIHQWQPVPLYRFALRILLSDWLGESVGQPYSMKQQQKCWDLVPTPTLV